MAASKRTDRKRPDIGHFQTRGFDKLLRQGTVGVAVATRTHGSNLQCHDPCKAFAGERRRLA